MVVKLLFRVALVAGASTSASAYAAEGPVPPSSPRDDGDQRARSNRDDARLVPGFGFRVGGYGFREIDGDSTAWSDCRMDGMGLFGTLDLNRNLFAELSADFYNARHSTVNDERMDRFSAHSLAAIGFRMFPEFVLTPYIQAGGGAEWTRIELHDTGAEKTAVYPMGFLGFGAEVTIIEHLSLGANVRMLLAAHPEHQHDGSHAHGEALSASGHPQVGTKRLSLESDGVETKMRQAAQAQFFLRYAL